ncbi:MAG: 2,3-bisphosphoglycerate-independent phosphoglycerate mutase, partial [Candidatus Methanoperedens sp.]|nr:2,3-bisphosphoglycerate-independent phosphoglycerate mutase [Candidatus Methanoperedens sp.]
GDFFSNRALLDAMQEVKAHDSSLHLMGLLSDGGVHSQNTHLFALLEMAKRQGIRKVYVHAFLDGRDVPPKSALTYIEDAKKRMMELEGEFARISGRYYAMDRDKRWERVKKAYDAIIEGEGVKAESAILAVKNAYARGETDEFLTPAVILKGKRPVSIVTDNDSVIFFNFRSDRAREITRAFIEDSFNGFERRSHPRTHFVCLTQYDETFDVTVAFPHEQLNNILAEILSKHHLRQLRIAETEKYAHVTFFFNGGVEVPFEGEDRILVPSPNIPTYDLQPQMSERGGIQTAHTSGPVPFMICEKDIRLKDGILADVAPTILELLGIEKPEEMTGRSLILPP